MAIRFHPPLDQLSWHWYRYLPRSPDRFDSMTGYRVKYQYSSREEHGHTSTEVAVVVSIDEHTTWVVTGKDTPELFAHEKLHYAIAVLIGQELERKLSALQEPTLHRLEAAQRSLYASEWARLQDIENAYEVQTKHSVARMQQSAWEARVDGWVHTGQITWP
jgi:hypothetical protein